MAKTAKVKKRQTTLHSRAARRAASPSIDLDKTLKTTTRDSASPSRPSETKPHVLAAQNAGITKKVKKGNMKRSQRLRHMKGMERAEVNAEKLGAKVQKSVGKEKKVKERKKGWDEVNGTGLAKGKQGNVFEALEGDETARKEREWVSDEEMDDGTGGEQDGEKAAEENKGPHVIFGDLEEVQDLLTSPGPLPTEDDYYL